MKILRKIWKGAGWFLLSLLAFIALYLLAAWICSRIGVQKENKPSGNDVAIYILSNGVHTDIVIPVVNGYKDWRSEVAFHYTKSKDTAMQWLALGWGDKGFYLETPEWSDLKASVAFKAMFYLGQSAMHATYYKELQEGERCRRIMLSAAHYRRLVRYLETSFERDSAGCTIHIPADYSYGDFDAFYEANGSYGLFFTCNTWANSALKHAGERACLWTPSDKGIFYQYRE